MSPSEPPSAEPGGGGRGTHDEPAGPSSKADPVGGPVKSSERPHPPVQDAFWSGKVIVAERGYLQSDKYIPLRAITKRPNVPFFRSPKLEYPAGVGGIMPAWKPFYVFDRLGNGLLIGESAITPKDERFWVRADECFCWTTRECLNIERPMAIYRTLQDARAGKNAVDEAFAYPYEKHFNRTAEDRRLRPFEMAALPLLDRQEKDYWCFMVPQGGEAGYELRWVKWTGDVRTVRLRVRTSRAEFDGYINGLLRLIQDYDRHYDGREGTKRDMYSLGLDDLSRMVSDVDARSIKRINLRRMAVPKLTGFLELPIESELDYRKTRERAVKYLKFCETPECWDADDVGYFDIENLP